MGRWEGDEGFVLGELEEHEGELLGLVVGHVGPRLVHLLPQEPQLIFVRHHGAHPRERRYQRHQYNHRREHAHTAVAHLVVVQQRVKKMKAVT